MKWSMDFYLSGTFQMQENGLERGLGNGHLGLDNSRTHIMRPTSERDIGLHETDFWAYPAGENIQTTIISRILACGVKHTQVKSTLSPNEAGNNISISGWIWSTEEARFTWWSIHFLWTMWKKSPRGKYVPRQYPWNIAFSDEIKVSYCQNVIFIYRAHHKQVQILPKSYD